MSNTPENPYNPLTEPASYKWHNEKPVKETPPSTKAEGSETAEVLAGAYYRQKAEIDHLAATLQQKDEEIKELRDALTECRQTINWMIDHMSVDDKNLQSDACNIPCNTLDWIDRLVPRVPTQDDLYNEPF